MPSPIAHAAVAFVLWPPLDGRLRREIAPWRRWALLAALLFALVAPDLDILLDPLLSRPAFENHGGATHSLFAGLVFGVFFAAGCRLLAPIGVVRLWAIGSAAYCSHVLLDACTYGRGVALFWPFTTERCSLPVPIFMGVRHSRPGAVHLHLLTVFSELIFAGLVYVVVRWWRRGRWASMAASVRGAPGVAEVKRA